MKLVILFNSMYFYIISNIKNRVRQMLDYKP